MLAAHPAINTIYGIDRKWKQLGTLKHLQKEWQLLCALRSRQYHLVINLADQWRSAIVTRFTSAPVRLGFGFNKRKNAFWRFVIPNWFPLQTTMRCIPLSRIYLSFLPYRFLPSQR
jgi:ADP-heptose:LPS heptosyltransferase